MKKLFLDYNMCAQSGSWDVIISTNSTDFFSSKVPVVDPLNFVLQYGEWMDL